MSDCQMPYRQLGPLITPKSPFAEIEFEDKTSAISSMEESDPLCEEKAQGQPSGVPSLPLPGSWLPISRAAQGIQKTPRHDFFAFLGVVQRISVDYFPITWHPALENIGEGATAEIREAIIDVQMSFAFKRFILSGEDENMSFRYMISEVSILGLEGINSHPNVIRLEGIGWDVPSDGQIMPVLVFEKTSHGDLATFLSTAPGNVLNFRGRLKLCIDIGSALIALNDRNVIHGDLGSRNVLVFEPTPGNFVAKISDFGYSSIADDQCLVYLPRTRPWYAPEWRKTAFFHAEAVKVDIFAYGLLSLWILFLHEDNFPPMEELEVMKLDNRLPKLARQLVANAIGLSSDERTNLTSFFHLTLSYDPNVRSDEFFALVHLLSCNTDLPAHDIGQRLPTAPRSINDEFSVLPRMMQFYFGDIRVRRYIAHRLETAATSASESDLYSGFLLTNILFQLAFCYEMGFGVRRNQEKATAYLEQSKTPRAVLDDHVKVVKDVDFNRSSFANRKFQGFWGGAATLDIEYDRHYGNLERLNALVKDLGEEIEDVEAIVGPHSPIAVVLKSRLSQILNTHGHYKQAEELTREILNTLIEAVGEDHAETLGVKGALATLFWNQGHLNEAEKLEREVVEKLKGTNSADDPETLTRMVSLATTLREMGELDEAGSLLGYAMEKQQLSLGIKHPTFLRTKLEFALVCYAKGQFKEAERLEVEILDGRKELFGFDHPDTLNVRTNLGLALLSQGRWDEAHSIFSSVEAKSREVLGENHPDAMSAMSHLAKALAVKGRWTEAENMQRKVLARSLDVLGLEHPDTLSQMLDLAITCRKQACWDEAESLTKTVVQEQEKVLGSKGMKAIDAMAVLSSIYLARSQLSEAESLATQIMERRRDVLGLRNTNTLKSMTHLGAVLLEKGDYQRAEELLLEVVRNSDLFGAEHPETLNNLAILASAHQLQGHLPSAEDLYSKLLEIYTRVQGEDHPDTQAVAGNLALVHKSQGRYEEARTLEEKLLETSKRVLGEKHPDTQVTMINLAVTMGRLGEWQQATTMGSKAMELMIETLGTLNEDTLACMHTVVQLFTRSGRWDEAEELCHRVVKMRVEVLGEAHPDTIESAQELNEIWRRKGDNRYVDTATEDTNVQ